MDLLIPGGEREGTVTAPPSKSLSHRHLICAALSERPSEIRCGTFSEDVRATMRCLCELGAKINETGTGASVIPVNCSLALAGTAVSAHKEKPAELLCGESGSTLRFLLPLVGAMGTSAVFHMEGNLPERPHEVYLEELRRHGMVAEQRGELICCSGKLMPGEYRLPGNVSSQFISGLLFALPLLGTESMLEIKGGLQSAPYVTLTEKTLAMAGIHVEKSGSLYRVPGGQQYSFPEKETVEGDWSAAAFFLCMGALSEKGVLVRGLDPDSAQGDREIVVILKKMGAEVETSAEGILVRKRDLRGLCVDAGNVPDLVPAICALASLAKGNTQIMNAGRLRMKETDRIRSTVGMLAALGADIRSTEDGINVTGKSKLSGGTTNSYGDHRIAMAAAVAACGCAEEVLLRGAECVSKSYPAFWSEPMISKMERER